MIRLIPVLLFLTLCTASADPVKGPLKSQTKVVPEKPDYLSDDGSEIRGLVGMKQSESIHCRLPPGGVIQASRHRTVEQIWYVLEGKGEMWRQDEGDEKVFTPLAEGTTLTVPLGTAFQFRTSGNKPLDIFIVNVPHWSGAGELIPVKNLWTPNFPK